MEIAHQSAGIGDTLSRQAEIVKVVPRDGRVSALRLPELPQRAGHLLIGDLIDLYMAHYAGRDVTRTQRLGWWKARLGETALQGLSDDEIHAALEDLAGQQGRFFAGRDIDGRAIYKARQTPIAPATVNRYNASLGAVITWAIKRRIAPKAPSANYFYKSDQTR